MDLDGADELLLLADCHLPDVMKGKPEGINTGYLVVVDRELSPSLYQVEKNGYYATTVGIGRLGQIDK